jgi:hypothetical protein
MRLLHRRFFIRDHLPRVEHPGLQIYYPSGVSELVVINDTGEIPMCRQAQNTGRRLKICVNVVPYGTIPLFCGFFSTHI